MTVVSAPGKVLVTGAYLVLERPNPGLVLSTSARFYAIVQSQLEDLQAESIFWSYTNVTVCSPQLGKTTSYKLSLRNCELKSDKKANFVEDAIQYGVATALAIANEKLGENGRDEVYKKLLHGLEITILGSNDFYSFRKELEAKGLPLKASTLSSLPAFSRVSLNESPVSGKAPEVAKTGLGSSASMTTAIVAGILQHLGVVDLTAPASLDIIHAASQAAHCHAQGKVGSGFDVSAAVYGSQKYVRFSPGVLHSAMDPIDENGKVISLEKAMKRVLTSGKWDTERSKFALPPMLLLMLGEPGHGGSDTPSMVGDVNSWRKTHENAGACWKSLIEANRSVEKDLFRLRELHDQNPEDYTRAIQTCSSYSSKEWPELRKNHPEVITSLLQLREHFNAVRTLLRQMGEEAGVPIEPPSQTELLDETMNLPGVLLAGVPGAGGFDAIFAITLSPESRSRVESRWCDRSVLTLTVDEDPRGVCVEEHDPRESTALEIENQVASIQLR